MAEETKSLAVAGEKEKEKKVSPYAPSIWNDSELMAQAWKAANFLAESNLVPQNYQKKPNDALIALDIANRTGMNPLNVMQNLYVVKGKPSWSGQMCIALVNNSKRFTPLEFVFVGENGSDEYGCFAQAKRIDNDSMCASDVVTIGMAKKEGWYAKDGSKWKTMPRQMMMYRAGAFFARVHCPDVLVGLQTVEEIEDVEGREISGSKSKKSDLTDFLKQTVLEGDSKNE
jgi:hypothetical protein